MSDSSPPRSPHFSLAGRSALVTGGNRGIGLGMAIGLAVAGASVSIVGRDEARNADVLAKIGQAGAGSCRCLVSTWR